MLEKWNMKIRFELFYLNFLLAVALNEIFYFPSHFLLYIRIPFK